MQQQLTFIPTREWVPNWLSIITAFIILLPIMLINGTYTGTIIEISGSLGILSEDINMAYYATSIGMAVAYPLAPILRRILATKTILLIDLSLQVVLSLFCANISFGVLLTVCSFFIGFLKGFAMMEIIVMIRPLFSPANIRSQFYAYFYPIVFSGGQISLILTAQLSYHYQWQYMYYFVALLLLIAILFIILFFKYSDKPIKIPYKEIDWSSLMLISVALLMIVFAFTYGKTLDWFYSSTITLCLLIAPFLLLLFIYKQINEKNPYIKFEVLNYWKAIVGYFFMILTMFFVSSGSIISSYTNSVLRLDSVHSNFLYLWMIPGFIIGSILSYWWFKLQLWRFRFLIAIGIGCFVIYLSIIYFGLTPDGNIQMLYIPMLMRGMGMIILFIAFGVFVVEDMPVQLMIYNAFFLITFRSVLSPAISTSFFSNIIYRIQQTAMTTLSGNIRMDNPLAAQQYGQYLNQAIKQGHSIEDASQLATNNIYSTLQMQSLLLTLKTITGYVLIAAIAFMIISCFIPFHKTVKVRVIKTGDDMV